MFDQARTEARMNDLIKRTEYYLDISHKLYGHFKDNQLTPCNVDLTMIDSGITVHLFIPKNTVNPQINAFIDECHNLNVHLLIRYGN